jgi:cytochrome c oxidase assembly factor CtaG
LGVSIVNYSIALRFFAVMLAVIGVGLMAIVAYFTRAAAQHMPAESVPCSRTRWLVVSFVTLAVACGAAFCP